MQCLYQNSAEYTINIYNNDLSVKTHIKNNFKVKFYFKKAKNSEREKKDTNGKTTPSHRAPDIFVKINSRQLKSEAKEIGIKFDLINSSCFNLQFPNNLCCASSDNFSNECLLS